MIQNAKMFPFLYWTIIDITINVLSKYVVEYRPRVQILKILEAYYIRGIPPLMSILKL